MGLLDIFDGNKYDVCVECKLGNHNRRCVRNNCTCCGRGKRR